MILKSIGNIFQKIVLKSPLFIRDRLIVHFLNIPVCTGHYDRYEDIIYGNESYKGKEVLQDYFQRLKQLSKSEGENIIERNVPLFVALAIAKEKLKRPIKVLDIGGGNGNEYFMCKSTLGEGYFQSWTIIERKEMVELFNTEKYDNTLKFEDDLYKLKENDVDVVILSGSLQYIPNPFETLRHVEKLNTMCIAITRTPFWKKQNRLTKQFSWKKQAGAHKGRLAYPFWLMNEDQMMELFKDNYKKILDYPGQKMFVTGHKGEVDYRAILLVKI